MRSRPLFGIAFVAVAVLAGNALAQNAGDGFLFKEPRFSIALSGGIASPHAGSDVFSYITKQLTVSRSDFRSVALGADLSARITPRLDFVLGSRYAGTSKRSEFRDFVDNKDLPIEQTTGFTRVPVTASIKAYLAPRGRSIGHFAWVPARYSPFVGLGGGATWYRLKQTGDFIDFKTKDIFSDTFISSGWAPTAHALAGLDLAFSPRFGLTGEGRYSWAKADLGNDFSGFDRIDLSGLSATVGVYARF